MCARDAASAVPVGMNRSGVNVQRKYSLVENQDEGRLVRKSVSVSDQIQSNAKPWLIRRNNRKLAGHELRVIPELPNDILPDLLRSPEHFVYEI